MKVLQKFLPQMTRTIVRDAFSNFEAGGEFTVYEVFEKEQQNSKLVCLFKDELQITNPSEHRPMSEIALGFNWSVTGCIVPGTQEVIRDTGSPSSLRVTEDNSGYYLYLLSAKR